jgi:tripartite-type tricarboxylate transporter receptor subunit TctC
MGQCYVDLDIVRTEEWTKEVVQYGWEADPMNSTDSRKFLERQHEELKAVLGELGLAK